MLDPTANYEESWNDLRRRGRLVWLIAASFLPGVLLLIAVESFLFGDAPEHFGRWVGGAWLAAFFAASVYRRGFRCTRCRQHFLELEDRRFALRQNLWHSVDAERHKLEGVVSKRRDAPYRSGACRGWRKIKTATWREVNKERWRLFERS